MDRAKESDSQTLSKVSAVDDREAPVSGKHGRGGSHDTGGIVKAGGEAEGPSEGTNECERTPEETESQVRRN